MDAKQSTPQWTMRTARVPHYCRGFNFASSCGRDIQPGEKFAQSKHRAGLDHAELCTECAALALATSPQ